MSSRGYERKQLVAVYKRVVRRKVTDSRLTTPSATVVSGLVGRHEARCGLSRSPWPPSLRVPNLTPPDMEAWSSGKSHGMELHCSTEEASRLRFGGLFLAMQRTFKQPSTRHNGNPYPGPTDGNEVGSSPRQLNSGHWPPRPQPFASRCHKSTVSTVTLR